MPDAVKAAHYLQLLDEARCDENWDAVPELVRKVRKHAPDRACLTLTAEIEHAISKAGQAADNAAASAAATAAAVAGVATTNATPNVDFSDHVPRLLDAIEQEAKFPEDKFQAQTCVGWIHWMLKEYGLASARLPRNFDIEHPQYEKMESLSEWTKVCALKSSYLRANCLAHNGQRAEALEAFDLSLPSLSTVWPTDPARQQLRYWAELFLTEYCMMTSQMLQAKQRFLTDPNCLACFRAWLKYWAGAGATLGRGYGFRGSVPRRRVWAEYYSLLSQILQDDLPFPAGFITESTNNNSETSPRSQLRAELKKVEGLYQGLLFAETTFPKADEERREIEDFVELMMQNWAILGGRGWQEQDLGQGGRDSLSHNVLDNLYGAALKTFHSTAVLRHLFIVHLAVAEFELAFKSFDSYFDLVQRGKARVEKTGHPEPSLDDDATVLETISACIAALCRYGGGREAAEKAHGLASELERWLGKLGQHVGGKDEAAAAAATGMGMGITPLREDGPVVMTYSHKIPPKIFALSWQSIGFAHAHWARTTFDPEARTQTQDRAIQCLRRSLAPEFGRAADIRGVFALALLYAEQRQLAAAIELVKTALLAETAPAENQALYNGPYWRERGLIPLWHLLALMLSARQEYFKAARACEGAIEQFRDPYVLFGGRRRLLQHNGYRSAHLNEAGVAAAAAAAAAVAVAAAEGGEDEKLLEEAGLVDDMDDYEKESILEIKMTQLAILEIVEGPGVAVNASRELLALFPRLFGSVGPQLEPSATPLTITDQHHHQQPPKTSTGTVRTTRGNSIFGSRSERSGKIRRQSVADTIANASEKTVDADADADAATVRPQTTQTVQTMAPTIQITNERGDLRLSRRSRKSDSIRRRSESRRRNSLRNAEGGANSGGGNRKRSASIGHQPQSPTVTEGERFFSPFSGLDSPPQYFAFAAAATTTRRMSTATTTTTAGYRPQSSGGAGLDHDAAPPPLPSGVAGLSVEELETFAASLPFVQFPQAHERRHRCALLVRVWLLIAGFYRRAERFENAQEACGEALRIVQASEADISKEGINAATAPGMGTAESTRLVGWGHRKSIEELVADVWAEKGHLSVAKSEPLQARADFETALTHDPDHASAIVGLSNILMDIYDEKLLPPPAVSGLKAHGSLAAAALSDNTVAPPPHSHPSHKTHAASSLPSIPLGLGGDGSTPTPQGHGHGSHDRRRDAPRTNGHANGHATTPSLSLSIHLPLSLSISSPSHHHHQHHHQQGEGSGGSEGSRFGFGFGFGASSRLPPPHKATSLPVVDRLAARDRAYGLLSGLTKLGAGWNDAEAWFALARAYEASGQQERAKEVLWWCVELEDGTGVRGWGCVGHGGYVL